MDTAFIYWLSAVHSLLGFTFLVQKYWFIPFKLCYLWQKKNIPLKTVRYKNWTENEGKQPISKENTWKSTDCDHFHKWVWLHRSKIWKNEFCLFSNICLHSTRPILIAGYETLLLCTELVPVPCAKLESRVNCSLLETKRSILSNCRVVVKSQACPLFKYDSKRPCKASQE